MVNALIITNYVIAVMTDVYATLQSTRLGLFYDELIGTMKEYKYNSRYGFLIATIMPFNILTIPILPCFIFIKDQNTLKKMNSILMVIGYTPVAIILTIIFAAFNIILIPFAYLAALFKKLYLLMLSLKKP